MGGAMVRVAAVLVSVLAVACGAAGGGSSDEPSDESGTFSARQGQGATQCEFEGPYKMRSSLERAYLTGGGVYQGCDSGVRARTAVVQTTNESECTAVACAGDDCVELECDADGVCTGTDTVSYDSGLGAGIEAHCEYTWTMERSEG